MSKKRTHHHRPITHYAIIARTHRPIPPLSRSASAGCSNVFDIYLYHKKGDRFDKLAGISFWTGPPGAWPDDYYTNPAGDKYLEVNAGIEAFSGVVDLLRNETNRFLHWDDPKDGRARFAIVTDAEPTGEGDTTPRPV